MKLFQIFHVFIKQIYMIYCLKFIHVTNYVWANHVLIVYYCILLVCNDIVILDSIWVLHGWWTMNKLLFTFLWIYLNTNIHQNCYKFEQIIFKSMYPKTWAKKVLRFCKHSYLLWIMPIQQSVECSNVTWVWQSSVLVQ